MSDSQTTPNTPDWQFADAIADAALAAGGKIMLHSSSARAMIAEAYQKIALGPSSAAYASGPNPQGGGEVKDSPVDPRIRNVQGGCNVIVRRKFAIFVPAHSPVTADQIIWIIERVLGRREH